MNVKNWFIHIINAAFCTVLSINAISQDTSAYDYIDMEQKLASTKMNFTANSQTGNYDIIYQKMCWEVDPGIFYIKGSVLSHYKTLADNFNTIYFDLIDELKIDSIISNGNNLHFIRNNNLVAINLHKTLNTNTIDSLTIYYQGKPDASSGFTAFDTASHNGIPSLWTLSEPYGAREWWPCKQSLTDKIDSIDIYVKTPKEYKVAANGKLIFEQVSDDHKLTYWKHRHPIATYLVAIAVTNYATFSHYAYVDSENQVEILNYVYPENLDQAKIDAEATVKVMEFFSDIFIPYPFYNEKYGHAQFGWGGGMEHQTMSFMKHFGEPLITHELAHQWFGDYITCASWQHIWVNEGFAEFSESLAQEKFYPETWTEWKNNEMEAVINNTESGSVFVDDTTDVSRIFDRYLTYKKGGLILQLLRTQVGDEAFFTGLKNYLNNENIADGFASAEDFKYFIEEAADTNLTRFFEDWYYGQGYPSYTINWTQNIDNKLSFTISQTTTHESISFFALKIPILLKGTNREQLVVFHNTTNSQNFEYNVDFFVDEVEFDPNSNIIAPPADIKFIINESTPNVDLIEIMPNPVNGLLTVKAGRGVTFNKILIVSTSGKKAFVENYNIETRKTQVEISAFATGVYYIRIITNQGEIVHRFVKS